MVNEALSDMHTPGAFPGDLTFIVLQDLLRRPIEIWMEDKNGVDIVNHPYYQIKENPILFWYNSLNVSGEDDH